MEKRQEQIPRHEYAKISSVLFLRAQDKKYKMKMKKQGRMIRRRKHLKQNIYDNNNIFQMPSNFNRKTAQNIIWQKNYKLKMAINILKQQNSSVKARLWNIQKESRKMDKQIETWNLEKVFSCSKNKPYIDMMTVSKVFADQDYEIVSTKIDIAKYERILQEKEDQIQRLTQKNKQFEKHLGHIKHISSQAKHLLLTGLEKQSIWNDKQKQFDEIMSQISNCLNNEVVKKNERAEYIKKNIELKKKANMTHQIELQNLEKEMGNFKNVNECEIEDIKQQMRKIRLEQRNNIKDFQKDLKKIKKSTINYECQIQDDMGEYIKTKIELQKKIRIMLNVISEHLYQCQGFETQILPLLAMEHSFQ